MNVKTSDRLPTRRQIEAIAKKLGKALGGNVNLQVGDLAATVDASFPGMTDYEYAEVRVTCTRIADRLRRADLGRLWGGK